MAIFGTFLSETLLGTTGNDTIAAGDGNDFVIGGQGNDRLFGDGGSDTLDGRRGNDFLDGGAGNDSLNGGSGNDTLVSLEGSDILRGGAGNDVFQVGSGLGTVVIQDRNFDPQEGDSAEDIEGGGIDTIVISLTLDEVFGDGNALGATGAFGAPDASTIFSQTESGLLDEDTAFLSFDNLVGNNTGASGTTNSIIINGYTDIEFLQVDVGGLFEITIPLADIL